MSLESFVWCMYEAPVIRHERLILIYLAEDSSGRWFSPTLDRIDKIAALSGYAPEMVMRAISGFIDAGILLEIDGHLWLNGPEADRPSESPWTIAERRERDREYHNANPLPRNPDSARGKSFHRIALRDGWQCHYCLVPMIPYGEEPDYCNWQEAQNGWAEWQPVPPFVFPGIDHKIPRSRGGTNALDNLVLCCRRCNSRKGTKDYGEFLNIVVAERAVALQ